MGSNISVFSDGSSRGTVVTTEDGTPIKNVADIDIFISPNDETQVNLHLRPATINVTGTLREITFVCPDCTDSFEHKCGQAGDGSGGTTVPKVASTPIPIQGSPNICGLSVMTPHGLVTCDRNVGHTVDFHFGTSTLGMRVPWIWGGKFGTPGREVV